MHLTRILSPNLPQHDLIATHPNWTRADFNRAVFHLSGRLKQVDGVWKVIALND